LQFLVRRLFALAIVLVFLVFATFIMVRLIPGDPAVTIAGPGATAAEVELARQTLGIDQPLTVQLFKYVSGLVHGDLGTTFVTREPVTKVIGLRLGPSLQLASVSLALVLLVSVPLGMLAGAFTQESRHQKAEVAFAGVTSVIGSLPEFLLATFLAFIFAVWLHLLPVAGTEGWQTLVLPVAAIALRPIATLARIVRVETLNVLAQDYMRTARSKRLPARLIYMRHALPNIVTAALTVGGLLFAALIGGAVIVENVFARLGLGTALVSGVLARDYPLIQGCIILLGFAVVAVNAIVDTLLALLDPRSLAKEA
jgi:peptide/nickel transport system permease protein